MQDRTIQDLDAIQTPQELDLLVAFSDLAGFHRDAVKRPPRQLFSLLSDYYEFVGDTVERAGGKVVKFIGDAALLVFLATEADAGMRALLELKEAGDVWLGGRGMPCHHYIKAHVGPVVVGPIGTRTAKRLDVFGASVNTAAKLKGNGMVLTPQAFRSLDPATRKLFKKHTPPVTYIPLGASHGA
jgi:class 3 adenylate cyclase